MPARLTVKNVHVMAGYASGKDAEDSFIRNLEFAVTLLLNMALAF